MIEQAAVWLYYQCAWFMVHVAQIFGISYRDANVIILFILWPLLLLGLLVWASLQRLQLRRGRAPFKGPEA